MWLESGERWISFLICRTSKQCKPNSSSFSGRGSVFTPKTCWGTFPSQPTGVSSGAGVGAGRPAEAVSTPRVPRKRQRLGLSSGLGAGWLRTRRLAPARRSLPAGTRARGLGEAEPGAGGLVATMGPLGQGGLVPAGSEISRALQVPPCGWWAGAPERDPEGVGAGSGRWLLPCGWWSARNTQGRDGQTAVSPPSWASGDAGQLGLGR